MRRDSKLPISTVLVFASGLTLLTACGDAGRALGPNDKIASLTVSADSSVVSVGHVVHISLTARDSSGAATPAHSVLWVSLTPDIASVSPSGAVDAVSTGAAVIEARVGGLSARADVRIVAGMEQASHDFDDGTIGPFIAQADGDLDFPADPTGFNRGNVARLHYHGSQGDSNRSIEFRYPRSWNQPIHFKGDFYVPVSDLASSPTMIRKLIYWQPHKNYEKYPADGGLMTGRTVVLLYGSDLLVDATYNPSTKTGKSSDNVRTEATLARGLQGNTWYTLEVFQKMESAVGRADGVLRVWLNGQLLFDRSTMTWSDPNWIGTLDSGIPFDASDIYFERFEVGDQVNYLEGSFDEVRYWDNLQFSAQPVGG